MTRSRDAGKGWSVLPSHVGRQTDLLRLMEPRPRGGVIFRWTAFLERLTIFFMKSNRSPGFHLFPRSGVERGQVWLMAGK